jgi:hypothetical protein
MGTPFGYIRVDRADVTPFLSIAENLETKVNLLHGTIRQKTKLPDIQKSRNVHCNEFLCYLNTFEYSL